MRRASNGINSSTKKLSLIQPEKSEIVRRSLRGPQPFSDFGEKGPPKVVFSRCH